MTLTDFENTLKHENPPQGLNNLLLALWYDGKGNWEQSHNIAQDIHTKDGSHIHAYLHRKEGDDGNAGYWYSRAGESFPRVSLDEEWKLLVKKFL